MPTPPAAMTRWNSIRRSLTRLSTAIPSKVAAFTKRLRSEIGPSDAGANGSMVSAQRDLA